MSFSEVFHLLLRRWWVIALVTVAAALAALGYSLAQPRIYRATAEVLVVPSPAAGDVKTYLETQMRVVRAALLSFPKTDPTLSVGLGDRLHVGLVLDEGRIVVEVDDQDPQQAARLANDLVARLPAWVDEFNATPAGADPIAVRTLVPAQAPAGPIGPRYQLNTAAGAALGLLLGLPFAFLWDALRRER